jgi:hypothetical protein
VIECVDRGKNSEKQVVSEAGIGVSKPYVGSQSAPPKGLKGGNEKSPVKFMADAQKFYYKQGDKEDEVCFLLQCDDRVQGLFPGDKEDEVCFLLQCDDRVQGLSRNSIQISDEEEDLDFDDRREKMAGEVRGDKSQHVGLVRCSNVALSPKPNEMEANGMDILKESYKDSKESSEEDKSLSVQTWGG